MLRQGALVLFVVAGCLGPPAPEGGEALETPSPSTPPVVTDPTPGPAPEPEGPDFTSHGLHFSDCAFRDNAFFFKHEWAQGALPTEYRPINYQAGGIGSIGIQVRSCAGLAIGNGTFAEGRTIGIFAVPVEPPAETKGPATDAYLFVLMMDDAAFAARLAESTMPVALAGFEFGESTYRVDAGPAFAALVTEASSQEQHDNYTSTLRLHWRLPLARCWSDIDHHVVTSSVAEALLEGQAGPIQDFAGPTDRLVGLGTHGTVSGSIGPPTCIEA